ncbi:hypothetical protein L228DRAFT_267155 [Xylona heveae TC161]|uniref:RRM domain-containing protein n=1 Tax=Xylona heveae (strain CBS 132557 / TC161) TaxID=1328760 RepID=A0A165H8M6_XYLHT|nr:hypothetical protein L228DRAFT_267155 [Xylona heveae TC161]KZF23138.1 hypothetical protein L228DRAFT_267155 [Xylona heveae TC161]
MQPYESSMPTNYLGAELSNGQHGTMFGQHYSHGRFSSSSPNTADGNVSTPNIHGPLGDHNLNALSQNFAGINLRGVTNVAPTRIAAPSVNNTTSDQAGVGVPQSLGAAWIMPDGRVMFTGYQVPSASLGTTSTVYHQTLPQGASCSQYLAHPSYQHFSSPQTIISPASLPHPWVSSQSLPNDLPGLLPPRRDSRSSNENDAPRTPFFEPSGHGDYQTIIPMADRYPISNYAYSTPSPPQLPQSSLRPLATKMPNGPYTLLDLDALTRMEPAIPRAIPTPRTSPGSTKSLEKSLHNPNGTTNVYIRGLLPDTSDSMLEGWASRFGRIDSVKAIVDLESNRCKGFGFVRYFNFSDAENCIRGFYHLGYEASFAQESFNSRLKTLGDPDSTNLYVSNLPRHYNEPELCAVFDEYKVVSSRVLRDGNGISRGVGFARFETRLICDEVISRYNGQSIGDEGDHLQIRYADTADQKQLKEKTSTNRQLRAHEYNTAVYGATNPIPYTPSRICNMGPPVRGSQMPYVNGNWTVYQESSSRSLNDSSNSRGGQAAFGGAVPNKAQQKLQNYSKNHLKELSVTKGPGVGTEAAKIASDEPPTKSTPFQDSMDEGTGNSEASDLPRARSCSLNPPSSSRD